MYSNLDINHLCSSFHQYELDIIDNLMHPVKLFFLAHLWDELYICDSPSLPLSGRNLLCLSQSLSHLLWCPWNLNLTDPHDPWVTHVWLCSDQGVPVLCFGKFDDLRVGHNRSWPGCMASSRWRAVSVRPRGTANGGSEGAGEETVPSSNTSVWSSCCSRQRCTEALVGFQGGTLHCAVWRWGEGFPQLAPGVGAEGVPGEVQRVDSRDQIVRKTQFGV